MIWQLTPMAVAFWMWQMEQNTSQSLFVHVLHRIVSEWYTPNVYLGVVNVGIRERAPTQRSHWLLVLLLPLLFYWAHIASIHFPAQFYGQSSAEWVQVGWGCPEIICNEVITVIAWNGKQKLSNTISSFRCIGCWCEENCLRRTYAMASCITR